MRAPVVNTYGSVCTIRCVEYVCTIRCVEYVWIHVDPSVYNKMFGICVEYMCTIRCMEYIYGSVRNMCVYEYVRLDVWNRPSRSTCVGSQGTESRPGFAHGGICLICVFLYLSLFNI